MLPEGQLAVTGIRSGSAGEAAGLDIGDILVALNGAQITATNFADILKTQKPGSEATLSFFRGGHLEQVKLTIGQDESAAFTLKEVSNPDESQKAMLTSWLGDKK